MPGRSEVRREKECPGKLCFQLASGFGASVGFKVFQEARFELAGLSQGVQYSSTKEYTLQGSPV